MSWNVTQLAIFYNDLKSLQNLDDDQLRQQNPAKQNALHWAAMEGRTAIGAFLITKFPEMIFASCCLGQLPLHYAVLNRKAKILDLLAYAYPDAIDFNSYCTEESPIQIAVANCDFRAVKSMLACKPSVAGLRNRDHGTLLHLASKHNQSTDVLVHLLHCCNPDVLFSYNSQQQTPLHVAVLNNNINAVKMLCRAMQRSSVHNKSLFFAKPFLCAVLHDYYNIAHYLLQIDPSVIDSRIEGCANVLHYAQNESMARLLVDKKPDLVNEFRNVNNRGDSVLHIAAAMRDCELLKFYLDLKPELIDFQNKSNETALEVAFSHRGLACVNEILKRSLDLSTVDSKGNTTLHMAVDCYCETRVISRVFAHNPANLYRANNRNETPFDIAVLHKEMGVMNMFKPVLTFEMIDKSEHSWVNRQTDDVEFTEFFNNCLVFGLIQANQALKPFLLKELIWIVTDYITMNDM